MDTSKLQNPFELSSPHQPAGDQPEAIQSLLRGFEQSGTEQVLLGVTGSGKTFTCANLIKKIQRPTLVIAHNKTLAAQLYEEFSGLFPKNAVEYFVSYYDYYQPEAYVPSTDTFIDKDSSINESIDRMRHSATQALFERNDVIIVSSVSCIYGLGSAEAYHSMNVQLEVGMEVDRDKILRDLIEIQFERNDFDFHRGRFRVRGDVVEVFPAHQFEQAYRIEWFGDEIEKISVIDPLRGQTIRDIDKISLFPTSHYVVTPQDKERAINSIRDELRERLQELRKNERVLESQRLEQRTMYDLEMIEEMGYCNGIENYSRHLTGRRPGQSPPTLLDYFPDEFLLIVDESHQTIPQIGAMYRGDQSRKTTLVEHGFRLPSALDNRPLQFDEFMKLRDRMLYVSATPGNFELERCEGVVTEQIIRPTGLLDPPVEIRPAKHQVDDLLEEIRVCVENGQRVLVTTLTKRMSEDLTEFYADSGVRVRYLHSDIDTLERIELIKGLRLGEYDVLVGINLLREGLDIPEVALVAILDADKEGFLRSDRALIQTMGRAARNVEGRIILYADKMTRSMNSAMDETSRRRTIQEAFNTEHNITPTSVTREIRDFKAGDDFAQKAKKHDSNEHFEVDSIPAEIVKLKAEMKKAAQALEFEEAASLRDRIRTLENLLLKLG
ncbi:MAG: excinuclease ABC subunit UvrB [Deltaproteobacteria bacterium]|jgi:excinuclease ABC subunit B|nr:excinuclease ABC subunit UvrB [Deltaproteobacteria bacterium]MBT6431462.1 excinuclease ABC subunit UvrB [Deltaproteobacteria bacterium]